MTKKVDVKKLKISSMSQIIQILVGLILFIVFVWLLIYFSIFLFIVFWVIFLVFFIKKLFQDWINYFKKWEKNNWEEDFCKIKKHFVLKRKTKFWDEKIEIEDAEIIKK